MHAQLEAAVTEWLATVAGMGAARIRTNYLVVRSLADLPTPVSGVITLADATCYEITGTVDIGTNQIECGAKTSIHGLDRNNDILQGTGTGALITCDSSVTVKQILSLEGVTLKNPNGSILNFTSTTSNQSLVVNNCTFMNCVTAGTINNAGAVVIRNTAFRGPFTTNGFTLTGTNVSFVFRDSNTGTANTGTFLNFGTAVFTQIVIGRNLFGSASGQTIISGTTGGANLSGPGKISENIFTGAGTYVSGITGEDTNWLWNDNIGITNTASGGSFDGAFSSLTGTPTTLAGYGITDGQTPAQVDARIALVVASAPAALDTLNELAAALGNDANYAATMTTALSLKAPLASPAFTGTPTGITATHVGLGNVTNTSDANKPVSTAQQTALDLKANLASPTFTGVPAVPTASPGTNTTQVASTAFVIANSGGSAPTYTAFTKDLGTAKCSGTFDITGLSGLTTGKVVAIVQTMAAITSKGNCTDEAEYDLIRATGIVLNATTIRATWNAPGIVTGDYNFAYSIAG